MKCYRLAALTTAGVLCIGLLAGCGTSHMSESELESVDSSWQQLSTPTPTPTQKAETVMPELEQKDKLQDGGTDVTKEYKNSFVGTWDDADGFDIYEFKSNENLEITTGKEVASYSYWLEDNGKQVLLYIFENGQEEAETYSFTLSGGNLTLYDTVSGNAVKQLVKRVNIAAPTATPKPTAAPATKTAATKLTTNATDNVLATDSFWLLIACHPPFDVGLHYKIINDRRAQVAEQNGEHHSFGERGVHHANEHHHCAD